MDRRLAFKYVCSIPACLIIDFLAPRLEALPSGVGDDAALPIAAGSRVPTVEELILDESKESGTEKPYRDEVKLARRILDGTPTDGGALNVAEYFLKLRRGGLREEYGEESPFYGMEWPIRYNPIIVTFFDATDTREPAGDTTAWCAAFVNWCIERTTAGDPKSGTHSAASQSFRTWGPETKNPKKGDLVVFQHKGQSDHGHVGFYLSHDEQGIVVLGGNQMPKKKNIRPGEYDLPNTGEVNISTFPYDGASLKFHSFRTMALAK
jgi:uncharacterized protein (TIGR02594 family)